MKRHFVHVLQDKMLLLESALAKVVITRVQTGIAELQECQQKNTADQVYGLYISRSSMEGVVTADDVDNQNAHCADSRRRNA